MQGSVDCPLSIVKIKKRINCLQYQKYFSWSSVLKVHLRTHTEVKLFKRLLCQKYFNRSCHLKLHLRGQ